MLNATKHETLTANKNEDEPSAIIAPSFEDDYTPAAVTLMVMAYFRRVFGGMLLEMVLAPGARKLCRAILAH